MNTDENIPVKESEPVPQRPDAEVQDAMQLIRRYGPAVGLGLAVALAVLLGLALHNQRQAAQREQASMLFMQARTPDDFQALLTDYPDSPEAPIALLALAADRYHAGDAAEARVHYEAFIDSFGEHPMRPTAELGLAFCDEAEGRLAEALEGIRDFAQAHTGHMLTPLARLGEARVLTKLGREDEARVVYEAMLADPDQPWAPQAEDALTRLNRRTRAAETE